MERKLSTQEEVKFGGAAMSLPTDLSYLQDSGGADREAALATLEKQLICPICLELFNKPVVILPCQHNLCRKCANELYQPSLFQARTTMMVSSGRFRCPSCRQEVVLDRHGVYGLQRNLLVENIIDTYKQEVSNANNASPLPLPPPPPPAHLTCSDHEGEKVNIYCLTCQVPTCSLCKVFGDHQSCQVAPLTDIYQQKKDELNKEVSSVAANNDKIQTLINELEETIRKIEENSKSQKQSVCDQFTQMMSVLGERHKAMAQQITSEQEEKTGHTRALMRRYGDSVETNAKLMEKAGSSMEELDTADFVQNSRELIAKVTAATSSCPTEKLNPGYENLSPYVHNFSRQERALKSIDFIKVVEEVSEEPVASEPEEPSEPSAHNTEPEPERHQESSTQNLGSDAEPVTETIPTVVSPPEEPPPVLSPPGPQLLRDSVEAAGAGLQLETEEADTNDERSDWIAKEDEEEEEAERIDEAVPYPVKENICEQQEGMSTQQCVGGGAESGAIDWTAQGQTEGKLDVDEEGEILQLKEETGPLFYPSWYKHEAVAEVKLEVRNQTEARDAVFDLQVQPPLGHNSQLLSESSQTQIRDQDHTENPSPNLPPLCESQPQTYEIPDNSAFISVPQGQQTAGDGDAIEKGDVQDHMCHSGTVEGSFGLGDGSLDVSSGNDDTTLSTQPNEPSSDMDKGKFELRGRSVEDPEEKEDSLGLNIVSELKEKRLGDELKVIDEGSEMSREEWDIPAKTEESSKVKNEGGVHHSGESKNNAMENPGAEFELDSSAFAENEHADEENHKEPGDFKARADARVAESKEKITTRVFLQAVTLFFYLLAFLVILQRVWAYIGCFICT